MANIVTLSSWSGDNQVAEIDFKSDRLLDWWDDQQRDLEVNCVTMDEYTPEGIFVRTLLKRQWNV